MLLAVLALGVAGCGDDEDDQKDAETKTASAELASKAKQCGFGSLQPGASADDVVPDGVLPEDAVVIRSDAGRAIVLLPGAINDAYRTLLANTEKAGLEIEFQEVETFDAELEIKTGDGVSKFALGSARGCPDVTRAVVTKQQG
jgi:hypothetical protein